MSGYLANIATELTVGILAAMGGKLRKAFELEPQQAALAECYRAGAAALLPKDDPNQKQLQPVLRDFFAQPEVKAELAKLVRGYEPDRALLETLFEEATEDDDLPPIDFGERLGRFIVAFTDQAVMMPELHDVIQLARLSDMAADVRTVAEQTASIDKALQQVSDALIDGGIYHGTTPHSLTEALQIYHQVLLKDNDHLLMNRLDSQGGDKAKPLDLTSVYIDLETKTTISPGRAVLAQGVTDQPDWLSEIRDAPPEHREALAGEPRLQTVVEALIKHRQLVLLGEPGGGKSTVVRFITHCLAMAGLPANFALTDYLPDWPMAERQLLPVAVTLRDFARSLPHPLPETADPVHLWEFILGRLEAGQLGFMKPIIERALQAGQAYLLLDGLDEVPSRAQRRFIRDAVLAFMKRHHGNRCLVTCRTLSYQAPDEGQPELRLIDPSGVVTFTSTELAPFDEPRIKRFIAAWYREMTRLGTVRQAEEAGLVQGLQEAVGRSDLRPLAPNPLLLTVMALVHFYRGLPEQRALLYKETVTLLLWRWDDLKKEAQSERSPLRKLLQQAGCSDRDLEGLLAGLAYKVHQGARTNSDEGVTADLAEKMLRDALLAFNPDDHNWVHNLIETIKVRAGLLIEREPGVFAFPHRTFQEYLAGLHLSLQPDFAQQAAKLVDEGDLWRQVILLAVGHLVHANGDVAKALTLVAELTPKQMASDEVAWRKVWWAGEVMLEIEPQRAKNSELGKELFERTRQRLAALVSGGHLAARERAEAGTTLAALGDPRQGVGVQKKRVADTVTVLPDLEFCYVPPGDFWMGDEDDGDAKRHLNKTLDQGYWLGRYSVTVGQFKAFVKATGYQDAYDDSLKGPENHPVRYVTWSDAMAFCRWVDEVWQSGAGGLVKYPLPPGYRVTLPSEAEWEKGARGGVDVPKTKIYMGPIRGLRTEEGQRVPDGRLKDVPLPANNWPTRMYPWGEELDASRANYSDTGVGTVSPVGAFPNGSSPYGCWDMAGNVFEWTRSVYQGYPYRPDDGRENEQAQGSRALRGGSFANNEHWLRCAARNLNDVDSFYYGLGFRLSVAPFVSER